MRIIDDRKFANKKEFEDIKVGECFIDTDDDISIKIVNYDTNETSAVCLKDGQQWFPHASDAFQIVAASLRFM